MGSLSSPCPPLDCELYRGKTADVGLLLRSQSLAQYSMAEIEPYLDGWLNK